MLDKIEGVFVSQAKPYIFTIVVDNKTFTILTDTVQEKLEWVWIIILIVELLLNQYFNISFIISLFHSLFHLFHLS